jgi:signal transduction histidine kinase
MQLCRAGDLSPVLSLTPPVLRNVRNCRMARDGSLLAVFSSGNEFLLWNLKTMRQELAVLGLDWRDAARAMPAAPAPLPAATPAQGFMLWLGGAAIIAAFSAVIMLRRLHGLMRDYSDAEATVMVQRKDLEQANFRLLHSQKMKALGTLAAGMAHDFNNMLSVIRMSNKLIARETRGNAEVSELVDSVEIAVLQGKQVVSSLLSYSRADEETCQPRPVADIVRETAILLNTEFLSGIILTLAVDAAAPEVRLAQGPVEQILLNLIVNAAEAMQGNGTLTIGVRTAPAQAVAACVLPPAAGGAFLEISVSDSGPGIPLEVAGRIFEPFFTTKNAGNDRGTGLGLSMVYTIAERDGLGLAVHSTLGQGACFSIVVPVPVPPVPAVRETPADNGPGNANE